MILRCITGRSIDHGVMAGFVYAGSLRTVLRVAWAYYRLIYPHVDTSDSKVGGNEAFIHLLNICMDGHLYWLIDWHAVLWPITGKIWIQHCHSIRRRSNITLISLHAWYSLPIGSTTHKQGVMCINAFVPLKALLMRQYANSSHAICPLPIHAYIPYSPYLAKTVI